MAQEGEQSDSDVKTHFTTREGMYQQLTTSDFFYPKRGPFISPSSPSHTAVVKTSFVKVKQEEDLEAEDCICFTVGKNLFYFTYNAFKESNQFQFVDKRQYKGAAPSCHDINQFTASADSVKVAVGFLAGQVQIIDVKKKESLQIMNEVRSIDKSSVTCVKWYPNSDNLVLSGHICGFMYTYDITLPCSDMSPVYHQQPYKVENGYSIYTVKTKSTSTNPNSYNSSNTYPNPLFKWVMSSDGTAVCSFEFSPCNRFVAVVTQNGYLRVIDHQTFESYGCMKSYFGGLMTCSWSPDGRFIATGGEDDLITVWSFSQQCVVARGSSHKSWVSDIAFDPYQCVIPSDADMKTYYNLLSVNEFVTSRKCETSSTDCITEEKHNDSKSHGLIGLKKLEKGPGSAAFPRCNGDTKMPVSSSAYKRLRTYSNVSRVSRLSIGVDAPPLCYRFGSIGQDSLLCLWEIDENTIDFIRRKPILKIRDKTPVEESKVITEHSSESPNPAGSNSDLHASSTSDYSSGGSNYQYYLHNQGTSNASEPPTTTLAAGSRSSSVPHSINSSTSSKKDAQRSSKSNTSNGLSMIRKFATIGSHDRSRKDLKQHKRNLSLPHFGGKSNQNGSASKSGSRKIEEEPSQSLGTVYCPRLEDTQMLDPLTCKKVSHSRLTSISFKEDSILITCQEGYMQAWKRPNTGDGDVPSSSHRPTSNGPVKVNGTVV